MNHPHVAKVLDGGLTSRGRPYFAMEYVAGESITQFCDRQRLSTKDRLRLFLQVCEAVQHAHTKGIIHRDLKPSNVLVSMGTDDQPSAKVIDFGIAKAVSGRITEQTVFTETGQMIGTPEYMSPEQADPGAVDIDTRTDVYSLGVILYELLSGVLPFDPVDLRSRAYREIQRVIREEDPPTPSARLSTIATKDAERATRIGQARKEAIGSLASLLKSELEWIPLKAMRKDRQERYGSPAELARDVGNYLEGRPLVAAPESTAYRVRKYVRRNRGFVAATTAVLAALVVGLGLAAWQWREATQSARTLRTELAAGITHRLFESSRAEMAQELWPVNRLAGLGAGDWFSTKLIEATIDQSVTVLQPAALVQGTDRERALAQLELSLSMVTAGENFAVSHDGRRIVASQPNGRLCLWDADTPRPAAGWCIANGGKDQDEAPEITAVAMRPDGGLVAVGDECGRVWLAAAGVGGLASSRFLGSLESSGTPARPNPVTGLSFSPDGRLVVASQGAALMIKSNVLRSGGRDGAEWSVLPPSVEAHDGGPMVRIWDVNTGSVVRTIACTVSGADVPVNRVAFDPSGDHVIGSTSAGRVLTWRVDSGKVVREVPGSGFALSGDGKRIAIADRQSQSVRVLDRSSGSELWRAATPAGSRGMALDGPGTRLAVGSDLGVRVYSARMPAAPATLQGHREAVYGVVFANDGSLLVSGEGIRESFRMWDMGDPVRPPILRGHRADVSSIAWCRAHPFLASGSRDGTVRLWDTVSGLPLAVLDGHDGGATSVAFDPAGRYLASGAGDGRFVLWDLPELRRLGSIRLEGGQILQLAFSPDSRSIAVVFGSPAATFGSPGAISIVDVASCSVRLIPDIDGDSSGCRSVGSVAWSSDSAWIGAGEEGTLRRWDARSGLPLPRGMSPAGARLSAARKADSLAAIRRHMTLSSPILPSLDGSTIISGPELIDGWAGCFVWDATDGRCLGTLQGAMNFAGDSVAFAADGTTAVAYSPSEDAVRLLLCRPGGESADPMAQGELAVLRGHGGSVSTVAFSHDGSMLAVGSGTDPLRVRGSESASEGTIRLYDSTPHPVQWERIRERRAQIAAARAMLRDEVSRAGSRPDAVRDLRDRVLRDPGLPMERRIAAMIVLFEPEAAVSK